MSKRNRIKSKKIYGQNDRLFGRAMESFRITPNAFANLVGTVGQLAPETGGLLFGSRDDYVVKKFYFDTSGSRSRISYDPDISVLNPIIKSEWENNGLALIGWAHSHPRGISRLSGDGGNGIGDLGYLRVLFDALPIDKFLVPIVHSSCEGPFQIYPYIAYRDRLSDYQMGKLELVNIPNNVHSIKSKRSKRKSKSRNTPKVLGFGKKNEIDIKLLGSIDVKALRNSHVVAVGCGGAVNIYENLLRLGIGKLSVIDFDTVDTSNLVTQGWRASQIGRHKVEALKEIATDLLPNNKTELNPINADFLEMSEKTLDDLVKDADLLLFMTDNFHAQARGNRLALKHKISSISAMMYYRARCCEITFTIPGITPGCHRCALSARYEAYLEEGYENDIGSEGSLIFQTHALNSTIGMLALAILHRNKPEFEFGGWFGERWDRNLIQLRLSAKYESSLFDQVYGNEPRAFTFDSVWQKIEPECPPKYKPCPDCGGVGDLTKVKIDKTLVQYSSNAA